MMDYGVFKGLASLLTIQRWWI